MKNRKCIVANFCNNKAFLELIRAEFNKVEVISIKKDELFCDEFYRILCANFEAIKAGVACIIGVKYKFDTAMDIAFFKSFLDDFKHSNKNLYYFPKPTPTTQINNFAIFALNGDLTLDVFRLGLLFEKGEISQFTKERLQKMIYKQNNNTKDVFKMFCAESRALFELSPTFNEFNAESSLNFLNLTKRATYFYKAPRAINIKMHNKCNLKCSMCWYFAPKYKELRNKLLGDYFSKNRELETDKINEIIDYAGANGCTLEFAAAGEPTLDKRLPMFIKRARDKGAKIVGITTNATILTKELSKKLLEAGLNRIMFSVDGANAETYEKIRGFKLEKTEKNIHNFMELCKNYEDVRIRLNYVLEGNVVGEQEQYLNKWSRYENDIQSLNFTYVTSFDNNGLSVKKQIKRKCVALKTCSSPWFPDSLIIDTFGVVRPDCVCGGVRSVGDSSGGGGL
ncbi:MAG: radical SAM protein [Helicobacteraceae bacterium]|nr:radical SAM protein [Helicobacteraceae bacterium]